MALEELVPVETPKPESTGGDDYGQLLYKLLSFDFGITDFVREKEFSYRGHKVKARGIPEDFTIFLDDEQVCEIVYDEIYNDNKALVMFLLSEGRKYEIHKCI